MTDQAGGGYLTVWSGAGSLPTASAIHAAQATHVILDVAGFTMPGFEYAKFTAATANETRNARLRRAQQAMRSAARS